MNLFSTIQQHLTRRHVARFAPGVIAAAALCIARVAGVCTAPALCIGISIVVLLACGMLAAMQPRAATRLARASRAVRVICTAVSLLAASICGVCAIELPWNPEFFQMPAGYFCLNLALVALLVTGLYFLGQRHAWPAFIGLALCLLMGLAEYFVYEFKGSVILPADVLGMQTAASVSMNYTYLIDGPALAGIICAWVGCHILLFSTPAPQNVKREQRLSRIIVNLVAALACFSGITALVTIPDYRDDWGIEVGNWFSAISYRSYGFVPSFISAAQSMSVEPPEGYSDSTAAQLQESYAKRYDEQAAQDASASARAAQFSDEQPSVIAIMNESFTDFRTVYGDLDAGYPGAAFFNSGLDDALVRGNLTVSVAGGGTCNSEFEFLTGNSLALMGAEIYPYELYPFSQCESLVSQFEALGYTTSAIHPNLAINWHRSTVYPELGFDVFYDIDSFQGAEQLRGHVTDAATYDKILELLEADDSPQFIFDVTMQNHSGYDTGLIPADKQVDYHPSSFDDSATNAQLNEYLACIEESDRALEDFISQLATLERPVVVVFFGDHQPGFSAAYNDALYPDEGDGIEHVSRMYEASYAIWANYDVKGREQSSQRHDTAACYLGAEMLDLIGAPLSEYQKAQLAIREKLPLVNAYGYQDANGTWHAPDYEDGMVQAYADFLSIEYRHVKAQLLDP